MNLYVNYSGFFFSSLKSYKLCGATQSDFLYLLRNGTTFRDPVLAATGEEIPIPLLVSLFDPATVVKLPSLDMGKNPRDLVDEVLRAGSDKEHGVFFRFAVEVGAKRTQRETIEWRKAPAREQGRRSEKNEEGDGRHAVRTLYTLHRASPAPGRPAVVASSSASIIPDHAASEHADDGLETLAVLSFNHVLSITHVFTLEFKGARLTGELDDRWALMVVTTSSEPSFPALAR
ncbi:hypothetical protein VTG60DRAFT_888 [Thermothelomyces hinnuleus]